MSSYFPEQPIPLYPSLARRFGVDEALLLAVYYQFARHHGHTDAEGRVYFLARRSEWPAMVDFWDEDKLAAVTGSLVSQGAIAAEFNSNGSIQIVIEDSQPEQVPRAPAAISAPLITSAPHELEAPPELAPSRLAKGPAPSFGGSTGWNRRQDDELETLFNEQEKRNQQLQEMDMSWRPNATTLQMLAKNNIPQSFADDQLDEFIAFWLAQGHKKKSWDPAFIDHVKRKWVREQARLGREARQAEQPSEAQGERHQSSSRAEKREKISRAVMDIKNINW